MSIFEREKKGPDAHVEASQEQGQESDEDLPDVSEYLADIHEAVELFNVLQFPLHHELRARLEEVGEYRFDNRKGSGFTRATGFLEGYIARKRNPIALFDEATQLSLSDAARERGVSSRVILGERFPLDRLREMEGSLEEGSRIFVRMLGDVILPVESAERNILLPPYAERDGVGSCTSAELKFLHILEHFRHHFPADNDIDREKERVEVILDGKGKPIMIRKEWKEKTCLTLEEVIINGVRLPPGTLLYAKKEEQAEESVVPENALDVLGRIEQGEYIPPPKRPKVRSVTDYEGFHYLRLTTFAISPENRKEVFKAHYTFQQENWFPDFDQITLDDFCILARNILLKEMV